MKKGIIALAIVVGIAFTGTAFAGIFGHHGGWFGHSSNCGTSYTHSQHNFHNNNQHYNHNGGTHHYNNHR